MAAFLQDNGAGQLIVAPVAPDKGVGHVEIANVFGVLDGHHLAQLPGVQNLLDLHEEVGVPQHMADGDLPAQGICLFLNGDALPGIGRDGLLQENVVAAVQGLHHVAEVIPVHSGDDGGIGDLPQGEQGTGVRKPHIFRNTQLICCAFQPVRSLFRNGGDFHAVLLCPGPVGHAPGTGANENEFHSTSSSFSAFFQYSIVLTDGQQFLELLVVFPGHGGQGQTALSAVVANELHGGLDGNGIDLAEQQFDQRDHP